MSNPTHETLEHRVARLEHEMARSFLRRLTPGDWIAIALVVVSLIGAGYGIKHDVSDAREAAKSMASRAQVEAVEMRVQRLEAAVEDVREIKADVAYVRGLLERRQGDR